MREQKANQVSEKDLNNMNYRSGYGGKKSRQCPFSGKEGGEIDYKDIKTLQKYVTERGRIIPRRITGLNAKPQRDMSKAIKRARFLSLLPYVVK